MKNFIIQLFLKRKKSKLQKTEKKLQIKRKTKFVSLIFFWY